MMSIGKRTNVRMSPADAPRRSTRIVGIDIARSIAILLAMSSHVWTASGAHEFFAGFWVDVINLATSAATPTFVILFGTMLELVYYPRFIEGNRRSTTTKLLSRAAQCWILYAISIISLFITHEQYSLKFSIATALMLGVTPFTDILKFYAVVLAISPLLLLARKRFGIVVLCAGSIFIHLAYPLLISLPTPSDFEMPVTVERVWKFLFGLGDVQLGGPSIMRGTTLVFAGMAIGRFLLGRTNNFDLRNLLIRAFGLLVTASMPLAIIFLVCSQETLQSLGNMTLRIAGNPLYFLVGLLFSAVLTASSIIITITVKAEQLWKSLSFMGRTSLFTFAFGNIILYLIEFKPNDKIASIQLFALLLGGTTLLSYFFDQTMRRQGWLAHRVTASQGIISGFIELCVGRLGPRPVVRPR